MLLCPVQSLITQLSPWNRKAYIKVHFHLQSLHRLVPEVWAAADRLVGSGVLVTPLLPSPWLLAAADSALPAAALPAAAYLKLENRQATGAFKARGAVNKVRPSD